MRITTYVLVNVSVNKEVLINAKRLETLIRTTPHVLVNVSVNKEVLIVDKHLETLIRIAQNTSSVIILHHSQSWCLKLPRRGH